MGKAFKLKDRKWDKLPVRYTPQKKLFKSIEEKAAMGLNKVQLVRMFQLPDNVFISYKEFHDAFFRGRDRLAERVCQATIDSDDYRDRNNVIQKMGLFTNIVDVDGIEDIESLIIAQGKMLQAFANGTINEIQLNSFVKAAATMSQSFFDRDVQTQLDELKKQMKEMKR